MSIVSLFLSKADDLVVFMPIPKVFYLIAALIDLCFLKSEKRSEVLFSC